MIKDKRPNILFLMETKCNKGKMEKVRVKLGYEGLFTMDSVALSGGLALLWKENQGMEIQNFSWCHINGLITHSEREGYWKLGCFYGHPNPMKRHEFGVLLDHLNTHQPKAWLCVGDFNEITIQEEKWGVALQRESHMD